MCCSGTITAEEISVMDWITTGMAGRNWQQNRTAELVVAMVCLKVGIEDANYLLRAWQNQLFQLGLMESGLVNVDTGQQEN